MRSLARAALVLAVATLGFAFALSTHDPPSAQANLACDVISNAGGLGTPVGDACNTVTDPVIDAVDPLDPLKGAVSSVGDGIFGQITSWVADGATWLLGEVAALSESTTTPNLLSKGFLRQYTQMAQIAVGMALLMVLFAVIEAAARGDGGMVARVLLVNVPLAAIATSAAYVLVALLLNVTDGLCHAISQTAKADTARFFDAAIHGLAEAGAAAGEKTGGANVSLGGAKATGAVAVPLFVGFIAATLAAFAAFLVWIELLMRDASVYAVALFMPFGLAAAIWPRWHTAFKRTAELIVVIVFSKFVIVAIIALAASLLADGEGGVEQVLSAGALLLLACFSPVMLMRFAPFAEGAIASAHSRQSAAGGTAHGAQLLSSAQTMQRTARASWGGSESGDGVKVVSRGRSGPPGPSSPGGSGAVSAKSGKGPAAGGGEAAGGGASAAAPAAPIAGAIEVAKAEKGAAGKLTAATSVQPASEPGAGGLDPAARPESPPARASEPEGAKPSAPPPSQASLPGLATESPEPTEAQGGAGAERSATPRPAAEVKASEGPQEDRK